LKVIQQTEILIEKWNFLLEEGSFSSPFQTHEYYNVISKIKDLDAIVFALSDAEILKVLMVITLIKESGSFGFFTRRGIIFGGPVINEVTVDELTFFLNESYDRLKGKAIYLETRNFFDYSYYKESFLNSGWSYEPYLNVKLNLVGITKEILPSLFKYNRRREINQSILNGATYHLSSKKEEILGVYQILKEIYRIRVKLPLPSIDLFYDLFQKDILKVFVVEHEAKIIGGSFCLTLPKKGLYTYYYCGQRDYHNRIFPAHLAILGALEYAIENHIPLIDFMGAGRPDNEYGVRNYKLEFGGELVEQGRFLRVLKPKLYFLGKLGLRILKGIKR
jgi:lipid II:glycine glycyltransferase (peptidoglycan interpeptide bridge formation enzyme)